MIITAKITGHLENSAMSNYKFSACFEFGWLSTAFTDSRRWRVSGQALFFDCSSFCSGFLGSSVRLTLYRLQVILQALLAWSLFLCFFLSTILFPFFSHAKFALCVRRNRKPSARGSSSSSCKRFHLSRRNFNLMTLKSFIVPGLVFNINWCKFLGPFNNPQRLVRGGVLGLESIRGRMEIEVNDYPGSGANNRHTPKPQLGRGCIDCWVKMS